VGSVSQCASGLVIQITEGLFLIRCAIQVGIT